MIKPDVWEGYDIPYRKTTIRSLNVLRDELEREVKNLEIKIQYRLNKIKIIELVERLLVEKIET